MNSTFAKRYRSNQSRHGLTLIEVLVSLILVSTVLLVSLSASANLFRDQSSERTSVRAHELAGIILDEISVRNFRDPDDDQVFGIEPSESVSDRTTFDDVDDYHGYVSTPPTYRDGPSIGNYSGWSFAVVVERAEPTNSGIALVTIDDAPLRVVTVTCTSPSGATTAESIIVSNTTNSLDQDTSFNRMLRVNLNFSTERQIEVPVPLRNHPPVTVN